MIGPAVAASQYHKLVASNGILNDYGCLYICAWAFPTSMTCDFIECSSNMDLTMHQTHSIRGIHLVNCTGIIQKFSLFLLMVCTYCSSGHIHDYTLCCAQSRTCYHIQSNLCHTISSILSFEIVKSESLNTDNWNSSCLSRQLHPLSSHISTLLQYGTIH